MAINLLKISLVPLIWHAVGTRGQNCYYPDGSLSTEGDAACSSQGGVCCPLNWECMSNGLCYLESEDYYGRYTCTDRTWQSSNCPQLCTQNNTAAGNEAILWCPNGDWCCDGNRVSFNCCTKAGTDYFKLPDPHPIKFISSVPSPTPVGPITSKPAPTSNVSPVSSSPASASSSATVTDKSLTTRVDGSPSTVTHVVTVGPAAGSPSKTDKSNGHTRQPSNIALIVGLAVGIPLVIIVLGLFLWWFVRHMRDSNTHSQDQGVFPPELIEANHQPIPDGTHALEKFGTPVAQTNRRSELSASGSVSKSPNLSTSTAVSQLLQWTPKFDAPPIAGVMMPAEISELPAHVPESTGLRIDQPGTYKAYRPEHRQQFDAGDVSKSP